MARNNEERAYDARFVLDLHNRTINRVMEPPQDAMGDLLADLMHLAKQEGFDFEKALATARMNFEGET